MGALFNTMGGSPTSKSYASKKALFNTFPIRNAVLFPPRQSENYRRLKRLEIRKAASAQTDLTKITVKVEETFVFIGGLRTRTVEIAIRFHRDPRVRRDVRPHAYLEITASISRQQAR